MIQTIAQNNSRGSLPFLFLAAWPLLILANFVPSIPQPESIVGYLWKVEFALAAFLFTAIVLLVKFQTKNFARFNSREVFLFIAPLLVFTVWSGLSVFWAASIRGALHHTLLWACYCIFYLLMRRIVAAPKHLAASFKTIGLVILILALACLAEYLGNPENITLFFTSRYYKYAEISVTLVPVFLALALKLKRRASMFCGAVAVAGWSIVILSLSRTNFIAGFVTVGLFFALVFLFGDWKKHLKKSALLVASLMLCAFLAQLNFSSAKENATIKRFSGSETSQTSFSSRFLFWGIAVEAFKQNPLKGVGADNYLNVYKPARESFSARDPENKLIEINESVLAERAHNEFLQILSELGLIGAAIFAVLLAGIAYLFLSLRRRASLLTIGSLAGLAGFLICSISSSYSFRVPANGLCFFFLLALAARSFKFQVSGFRFFDLMPENWNLKPEIWNLIPETWNLKPAVAVLALLVCVSMLAFSAVRGASLMYFSFAMASPDKDEAERFYQKAMWLDGGDPSFRFTYGTVLYQQKRYDEASAEFRRAVDGGVATSTGYFYLASTQIVSRRAAEAERTFAESLKVYPRSVFLRTAYASFLLEAGETEKARVEFEKALRVDAEQAESWMTAHDEGLKKLTEAESRSEKPVKAMDLKPLEGVYALLDLEHQINPNLDRR